MLWQDSREYLNGASKTNKPPGRHQIQNAEGPVLDAKQIYFRRDLKVDPLRIESGPSWWACFWSLHFVRCAWSYFNTNSIRGRNLKLGRRVFACLIFLGLLSWHKCRWQARHSPFPPKQRSKCRCCKELLSYFSILARAKKAKKYFIFNHCLEGCRRTCPNLRNCADKVPV